MNFSDSFVGDDDMLGTSWWHFWGVGSDAYADIVDAVDKNGQICHQHHLIVSKLRHQHYWFVSKICHQHWCSHQQNDIYVTYRKRPSLLVSPSSRDLHTTRCTVQKAKRYVDPCLHQKKHRTGSQKTCPVELFLICNGFVRWSLNSIR